LLNETLFFSLDKARKAVAEWVAGYNTERALFSLAYETPAA
jgi:putative transposase